MEIPMTRYALALMAWLVLLTPPALAEPARTSTLKNFGMASDKLKVTYKYYDVAGRDLKTVFAQLNRIGPFKFANGKTAHGLTDWKVSWPSQFVFISPNNVCIEFNVTVTSEITFTMPRWTGYAEASEALKKGWDTYYQGLQKHEDGHALHGVGALTEIVQLQPELTPGRSCQKVAENFNARVTAIIKKYNRKDIEYDQETQRRQRQGSAF